MCKLHKPILVGEVVFPGCRCPPEEEESRDSYRIVRYEGRMIRAQYSFPR